MMSTFEGIKSKFIAILAVITLAACNGGGGSGESQPAPGTGGGGGNQSAPGTGGGNESSPPPVTDDSGGGGNTAGTAEGAYIGFFPQSAEGIVGVALDDGQYWLFYSTNLNSPADVAGLVQGSYSSSNGNFTSSNGMDYYIAGQKIAPIMISASYMPKQTLQGTITYTDASGGSDSFALAYDKVYDSTPSLSKIAGTYDGSATVLINGQSELTTVTINASGAITGTGESGCSFGGTATPYKGNAYRFTITFNGGVCLYGTSSFDGIGILNTINLDGTLHTTLYSGALNASRNQGVIFGALKRN